MTTKKEILGNVNDYCYECAGFSKKEVRLCPATNCQLHPYRMGQDPNPSKRRGFAKQPADKTSFGRENDPPPKAKTPACAPTQNRGKDETPKITKSKDVSDE